MNAKPVITILALLAFAGCATTTTREEPKELVRARNDYHAAANGPAAQLNPGALYMARKHLDRAELAFADAPDDPYVRDQAYIADRKALLADAQARLLYSKREEAMARKELEDMAATAATDLRAARESHQRTQAELDAERARLEALQKTGDLTEQELASKELELQATQETLDTEREARIAADKAREAAEDVSRQALAELARSAQVREDQRGTIITISGQVLFAFGKSTLLPAARKALDDVAVALKASPHRDILVEGHTDSVGAPDANVELSQRRADAVRSYLVSQGVPAESIAARGVGEERPVATNDTPDGRANNRRVEIILSPLAPPK